MGRTIKRTLLDEEFHDYGKGMAAAKAAFDEIEKATSVKKIDLSVASLLSPVKSAGDFKTFMAVCDGRYELVMDEKTQGIVFAGIRNVEVGTRGEPRTVLVDGGYVSDKMDLADEYSYVLSDNAIRQMSSYIHADPKGQSLMRDLFLSERIAALPDEYPVNLVCREKDGIKVAVAMSVESHTWPTFDEIIDEVCGISDKLKQDFKVAAYDITQKRRKISFKGGGSVLTFQLTDTDTRNLRVSWNGKEVKVPQGKNICDAFYAAVA